MHSILSIAALQLGYLHVDPTQSSSMNAIAVDQMNQALVTYRPAIETITEANAPSLFATATLTTVFAFRTATVDMQDILAALRAGDSTVPRATAEQLISSVARTVWLVRSALSVLSPGWQWIRQSKMSALCTRDWWPKQCERLPANAKAMEEDARLCAIQKMWVSSSAICPDDARCLTDAMQKLREAYALVSQLTVSVTFVAGALCPADTSTVNILKDRAAIIVWAAKISRQFVRILERGNDEAMIVVAHWAVLLARIRNVWWSDGLGSNIVKAIAMILGKEKWDLLRWPAEVAGVVLEK
ncbi:hypothetical protein E8E12_001043 [Didymella heteroderae]|uniref:Sequence-specific DNA binding RNA polymerase II transcription factor n=1 Tax=Didymella heteroderae TaxID=1769908 RepID=A0A9P4WFS0_9PLEO|nr:hypothetical protein E8E12_001043 [Didymella heteroderae]